MTNQSLREEFEEWLSLKGHSYMHHNLKWIDRCSVNDVADFFLAKFEAHARANIERLGKEIDKLPYSSRLCQNQNGLEYCGTCEQAWDDCSCSARNTGYKKAKQEEITFYQSQLGEKK